MSSNPNKQNYSNCEQINFHSVIFLPQMNLWRLMAWCPKICLKHAVLILSIACGCEAKIANFKIEILIYEQILRFEISM